MIIAAAIRGKDGTIWTLPPPARHHDIGRYMIENGEPAPYPSGDDQGFIISNRCELTDTLLPLYVRRPAAKRIAERAGQILPGQGQHKDLYSEDVW